MESRVQIVTGQSKAEETSLSTHHDNEEDSKVIVPAMRIKTGDEKVALPGQVKVDKLLKAHRGDRDMHDVSNKDAEKEPFFRLMY